MAGISGGFVEFGIFGDKETARALKRLGGRKTLPRILQIQAMKKSAKRITKAARSNIQDAPTHTVKRKGKVVAKITRGQLKKSLGTYVGKRMDPSVTKVYVGPRLKYGFKSPETAGWYGHFVEYGHMSVFGHVPAHPFIRKSNVDTAGKIAGEMIAKDFIYVIRRRAKKLGITIDL
jgi:HK97 gp10 family phage protein